MQRKETRDKEAREGVPPVLRTGGNRRDPLEIIVIMGPLPQPKGSLVPRS
jgi:hypothetical protein